MGNAMYSMNDEYHPYGQHQQPHYRNRLNATGYLSSAAERIQIARYALYAIIIVVILVLHLTAVTTYGGAIIAWDHLARLAERGQATNPPPPVTEAAKAKAAMDNAWNEFQKNDRKRKTRGNAGGNDTAATPDCYTRMRAETCTPFDYSRAKGAAPSSNNGYIPKPYPRAKVMISSGCSMSSSAFAILRKLVWVHHAPQGENEVCGFKNELLHPAKNPCGEGDGVIKTDDNMTVPLLENIATMEAKNNGQPLVVKFEPNRLQSVEPEIHDYVGLDAVTVYRENLLDRALCMSMDCFNNVATTVFAKNGTKS